MRVSAYADAFPHSYTDEAVRVGRALIVAIADEDDANASMLVVAMTDMLADNRVLA